MQEKLTKPVNNLAMLVKKIGQYDTVAIAVIAVAVVLAISAVWEYTLLSGMRNKVTELEAAVHLAGERTAALAQKVSGFENTAAALPQAASAQLAAQADAFENQIITSASALLKSSLALAKKEMAAFGPSGYRFNMVEFDKRSCPGGGVFSGEHPDGERQEKPFEPNNMVEILESHRDVRGIPFYRVKINSATVQQAGEAAAFRHGSMRIECN